MGKNGGSGQSTVQAIFDPGGWIVNQVTPKDGFLGDLVSTYQAPIDNTWNVIEGKEQLGSHESPFGTGFLGDIFNPIMGGLTDEQRQANQENDLAWQDYYRAQAEGYSPPGTSGSAGTTGTSTRLTRNTPASKGRSQSLLLDGEDDI